MQGMTKIELTNVDTAQTVEYDCADIQCAQMLAAEDHGGEPSDWLTADEIDLLDD